MSSADAVNSFESRFYNDPSQAFGGSAPLMNDYIRQKMNQQSYLRSTEAILMNDPRVNTMLRGMGADPSLTSPTTQLMMGMALNNRFTSQFIGGSRVEMFRGVTSGVSSMRNLTMMRNGQEENLMGPGGVTSRLSHALLTGMESHFFTDSGGARLHRTRGMSRDDLGSIAAIMLARGGGREFGPMGRMNEKGQIEASEAAQARLNQMVENTAEAVSMVRDFAGDMSMGDSIQALDRIMGGAVRSDTDIDRAKQRLQQIKEHAETVGASIEGWFSTVAEISDAMQSVGVGARAGTAIGMRAARDIAVLNPREEMRGRATEVMTRDNAAMLQETPELAQALYALQTSGFSDVYMDQIRDAMASGDPSTMQARMNAIARDIEQSTGVGFDVLARETGGDFVGNLRGGFEDTLAEMASVHMNARRREAVGNFMVDRFGASTAEKIMGLRGSMTSDQFDAHAKASGDQNLIRAAELMRNATELRDANLFTTEADERESRRRAVDNAIAAQRAAQDQVKSTSGIAGFMGAFFDDQNLSTEAALEIGEASASAERMFGSKADVDYQALRRQAGSGGHVELSEDAEGRVRARIFSAEQVAEARKLAEEKLNAERVNAVFGRDLTDGESMEEVLKARLKDFSEDDWKRYAKGESTELTNLIDAAALSADTALPLQRLLGERLGVKGNKGVTDDDVRAAKERAQSILRERTQAQNGAELTQILSAISEVVSAIQTSR